MSMWLPGGAGASSRSGSSTTCRTCWATSQTSSTRALPHRLWVVAPIVGPASEAAAHEARGRLFAVAGDGLGRLGALTGATVGVLLLGVGRAGQGAHLPRGVARRLPGLLDVGAQLPVDQPLHDAPGPHAAGIDVEVVEVVARVGLDTTLLGLEHHLVLEEHVGDALTQPGSDHLLVQAPVARRSEERRVGKECRSRWSPYH